MAHLNGVLVVVTWRNRHGIIVQCQLTIAMTTFPLTPLGETLKSPPTKHALRSK
ncbi:MAG: hypothetical protein MJE68_25435 [Proteobacteria bacterium]|nr:hypothetical protein [Pseudomonadota bacterium]